jgi:hypothetical protein
VTRRVTHPARAMESSGFQTQMTLSTITRIAPQDGVYQAEV